jgi:hypothetical protein
MPQETCILCSVEIEEEPKYDEDFGPLCKPCYIHTLQSDGREAPTDSIETIPEEPPQDNDYIERFHPEPEIKKEEPIYLDEDYPLKEEYVPNFTFDTIEPLEELFETPPETHLMVIPEKQPQQDQSMGRAANRILDVFGAIPGLIKDFGKFLFIKKKKPEKSKPAINPDAPIIVKRSLFDRMNIFKIWYGNKKIKIETGLSPRQRIKRYNASMEERENASAASKTKRQR